MKFAVTFSIDLNLERKVVDRIRHQIPGTVHETSRRDILVVGTPFNLARVYIACKPPQEPKAEAREGAGTPSVFSL